MIRPYRVEDDAAVSALLAATWPDDPALVEISSGYRVDTDDDEGRSWRTRVAEVAGEVVGFGSLAASARSPTRYFLVVAVADRFRRRGIGRGLLAELRTGSDGRPLQARVRLTDEPGLGFLRAHGFGVLMRNRTGVVEPSEVAGWVERQPAVRVERGVSRERMARAHAAVYRSEHASWSPISERPLEDSLEMFCGESWLPETALLAEGGVASLHGPPLARDGETPFLLAGTTSGDERTLRALVAAELAWARDRGKKVSVEADEANAPMWAILSELPVTLDPELLLLATDARDDASGRR